MKWKMLVRNVILLLLVAGVAVALQSWSARSRVADPAARTSASPVASQSATPGLVNVIYEGEGVPSRPLSSGKSMVANLTMRTLTGLEQGAIDLPLLREDGTPAAFEAPRGTRLYLSLQADGYASSITCRILVDGKVTSENTATGYGVAACEAVA